MKSPLKIHIKILEEALSNKLPNNIIEKDRNDFDVIEYLFQNNYLSGFNTSEFNSKSFIELKITETGKNYLVSIKNQVRRENLIDKIITSIPNSIKIVVSLLIGIPTAIWALSQFWEKYLK